MRSSVRSPASTTGPRAMTELQPAMKWWGWGDPAQPAELPPHALDFLRGELGISGERHPPVALEDVRLVDPALPRKAEPKLVLAVGREWVRNDRPSRVAHAAGKGYVDLVRLRAGDAVWA